MRGVCATDRVCAYLEFLLAPGLATARREGHRLPDDVLEFLRDVRAGTESHAAAANGSAEVDLAEVVSISELADELTTKEVAEATGRTDRGVRDALVAQRLKGRKVGRVWLVTRLSVIEWMGHRKAG